MKSWQEGAQRAVDMGLSGRRPSNRARQRGAAVEAVLLMRVAVRADLAGVGLDRAASMPPVTASPIASNSPIHCPLPPPIRPLTLARVAARASQRAMAAHRPPRRQLQPGPSRRTAAMSLAAMEALGLDEVWWLVSPGNPLKDQAKDMAPYAARLASAPGHGPAQPDPGQRFRGASGTRYTVDTLRADPSPLAAAPLHLADGRGHCGPIPPVEGLAALGAHGADCGGFAPRL